MVKLTVFLFGNPVLSETLGRVLCPGAMAVIARIFALVSVVLLASCDGLPRGAALQSEVLKSASGDHPDAQSDFAVAPVIRAALPRYAAWPTPQLGGLAWMPRQKQPANRIIAPGDTVSVRIWSSEENGLLTSGGQKLADLGDVRVAPTGRIFLPYIDEIKISGMSPEHARRVIQDRYSAVAPSAQVMLSLAEGRKNTVSLVGGVGAPGSYPMPDTDFTILALLSQGGGVAQGLNNPQIRLHRHGRIYGTSVDNLYTRPANDTTLRGGDKVIVQADTRAFLSLGAAGQEARHLFPKDHLTAIEALSIVGGVSDFRADPKGVLILRHYPARSVAKNGQGPDNLRMVFTIDLTTADGLFSAGKFRILPGDLVYATEAPVTAARTILGLLGSAFGVYNVATQGN